MSYWVSLCGEDGEPVEVANFSEGGTFVVGGSTEADLNITYNYSSVYKMLDFDLDSLDGKKGKDCIEDLDRLVQKLGTTQYKDYWAPTPGNAGLALSILLEWARLHPTATFKVN